MILLALVCFILGHDWMYTYLLDGDRWFENSGYGRRRCLRCGKEQLLNENGEW